jgi:Raf kinase inhibitor-like YbhB/YbcL family protein
LPSLNLSGETVAPLVVSSSAIGANRRIPLRCAHRRVRGGENISPPVSWSEPPDLTRSIVVTIIDHHPIAHFWVHWCVSGIPPNVRELQEGASLHPHLLPAGVIETVNSYGEPGYGGPAPPPGSGPHEYVISVYALGTDPQVKRTPLTMKQIDALMAGGILASGSCSGVFERT